MMKVEIPNKCPSCSSELELVKDQLFCRNTACSAASLKRICNFTKKVKIKGFGEKTVEKLNISSIPELYTLTEEELISVLGEKMGTKLYKELDSSKTMPLTLFLGALSIPLVGTTIAKKFNGIISSLDEISEETCEKAGLGEKATASLLKWKLDEYPNYIGIPIDFSDNSKETAKVTNNTGLSVCVTGKIEGHTRSSIAELLDSLGVKVGSSVTSKTNYLICEELKGSSKETKAESLGIEIITLNEFIQRIS